MFTAVIEIISVLSLCIYVVLVANERIINVQKTSGLNDALLNVPLVAVLKLQIGRFWNSNRRIDRVIPNL